MSNSGANAIPLLTPYKMGKFDLSHRYALFFGWGLDQSQFPNPQSCEISFPREVIRWESSVHASCATAFP